MLALTAPFTYTPILRTPRSCAAKSHRCSGTSIDNVVVRTYAGPGHYGRSNGGNAGAEDEAVILSKAVGKPVRVQWMRPEDFQWSTQSPAAYSDVEIGLDASGKMVAYQADHYMPAMQDDRPVGAVLAGLPTMAAPNEKAASASDNRNSRRAAVTAPQKTRLLSTVGLTGCKPQNLEVMI